MQTLRHVSGVIPTVFAGLAFAFLAIVALPNPFADSAAHAEQDQTPTLTATTDDGARPADDPAVPVEPLHTTDATDKPIVLAQATFIRQDVRDNPVIIRPETINRSTCRNGCLVTPQAVTNGKVKERYWFRAPAHVGAAAQHNSSDVTIYATPVIQ